MTVDSFGSNNSYISINVKNVYVGSTQGPFKKDITIIEVPFKKDITIKEVPFKKDITIIEVPLYTKYIDIELDYLCVAVERISKCEIVKRVI